MSGLASGYNFTKLKTALWPLTQRYIPRHGVLIAVVGFEVFVAQLLVLAVIAIMVMVVVRLGVL